MAALVMGLLGHGVSDGSTNAVYTLSAKSQDDRRCHGSKRSIRCNGSTNVCPSKSDHLERSAQNDTGFQITGNKTN